MLTPKGYGFVPAPCLSFKIHLAIGKYMSKYLKRTGLMLPFSSVPAQKLVLYRSSILVIRSGASGSRSWSRVCAPREMAQAQANKEFAELEFQQASPFRAEDYPKEAWDNVSQVAPITDACRPQDKDGDGLMDHIDACPDCARV